MRRSRSPFLFLLCLGWGALSASLAFAATGAPWPHELGDVPPDPAIHWGRLENGLRYAVRKNSEPAGRVHLILQVAAGSLNERDDQRGYAHFLEHMMFRGTKKYPANSLVNFLQHEGLAMGADSSAYTNYHSTFYYLDLPQNTPPKITLGLSILRDFADGAIIAKADVKREAKVVASERRTRDNSASRVSEDLTSFLYPDSLITQRQPIGTPESVDAATAEGLREFYRTWYRPTRMTVIAVGDAEPEALEKLIRDQFGSLRAATPEEPADPDLRLAIRGDDVQVKFVAAPQPGGTSSVLYVHEAVPPQADTIARRQRQIADNASFGMLNARLADLARARSNEVGEAEAGWSYDFERMRQAYVRVDTRVDLWRAGLRLGEQELRRALLHGFTADEVKVQVQAYTNGLEEAVRTAPSRQSAFLAQTIRNSLEYNFIVASPETEREIATPAVAALTPALCSDAFRAIWAPANRRIAVIGFYPTPLTGKEILTAYDDSRFANFFTEQDAREIAPFDYTDFGKPGTVQRKTHDDRVDVTSLTFANGVRANLKKTDYEKGRVYLRLRLGLGMMAEPVDKPGLGLIAEGAFPGGGVGHYNNVELVRRLAGDTLGFNFTVEEDGFYFTGYSSPDKFEKLLQVVAAFLTDPAFREEGFQATISRLQSHYPTVSREPVEFLRALCPSIMAGGDLRYGLVTPDRVGERKPEEISSWLKPILAKGSIEVGVAGDIAVDTATAALARTLGALPLRDPVSKLDFARKPALPLKPAINNWVLAGAEPSKAAVRVYWPGVDDDDYRTNRRLQVLAEILNDRLRVKIREELGATYGPQQSVWGSTAWPGYGYFFVEIETTPALADKVGALTRRIAADIVKKGVTQDEFERVIEPRLATLNQELRNNQYWTHHLLSRLQENPGRVSWPLTRSSDYQGMARTEIDEVARRYMKPDRAYTFIARPKQ